jgi:hypothetical protein
MMRGDRGAEADELGEDVAMGEGVPEGSQVRVVQAQVVRRDDALEAFAGVRGGLERAKAIAHELNGIIAEAKLSVSMGGDREHLRVEAWCAAGAMVGVSPRTVWARLSDDVPGVPGYTARVEVVRLADGAIVCAAEADCYADEVQRKRTGGYFFKWIINSPDYEELPTQLPERYAINRHALKSMAQTRATSKALAQHLRWIAVLGGYSGTPAEEMTGLERSERDGGGAKRDPSFERGAGKARARSEAPATASRASSDVPRAASGAWYKKPPSAGPAPADKQISEGKRKAVWAWAFNRSQALGGAVKAEEIVAKLCTVLGLGELREMHFTNFGDERKPERYPNWVKDFVERFPAPSARAPDPAVERDFVNGDRRPPNGASAAPAPRERTREPEPQPPDDEYMPPGDGDAPPYDDEDQPF